MRTAVSMLLPILALAGAIACDKKSDTSSGAAANAAPGSPAAPNAATAAAATVAAPSGPCPDGTWLIASLKDQSQELFQRSGARDMKVVETSGGTEYTFTPTGPDSGKFKMDAVGGKALTLVVDSPIGDQKQRTRAEVSGTVEGNYRKLPSGELDVSTPTTMNVTAKATVTIAGKTIDLPSFPIPEDAWHGTVRATCAGNAMTIVSSAGASFYNGLKLVRR